MFIAALLLTAAAAAGPAAQSPPAPPPSTAPISPRPASTMPPANDKSARPKPANAPSSWILFSDYPEAAAKEGREGKVSFKVTVAQDGFVIGCDVTKSSGSDDLDNTTCALVAARALFTPALDANGKPVIGIYSTSVSWDLPDPEPAPAPAPAPSPAKPPQQ